MSAARSWDVAVRAPARWAALLLVALLIPIGSAEAAPRARQDSIPDPAATTRTIPIFTPPRAAPATDTIPRTYEATVRRFATMSPSDSMGDGDFRAAEARFTAGRFDDAVKEFHEFARRYPRNLHVNDALSTMLLIQDGRDFEDRPLLLYARARAHRAAGRPDSAVALLTEAAERFPGAKVRHHVRLLLAELAHDRADHAEALRWAVAAADTAASNRLAPFALRLAAESSLAMGEPPSRALAYFKTILERYPASAVTPGVRTRALEIRRKMPQ
jgi:tetratricopeptide (TPR) repeat protein